MSKSEELQGKIIFKKYKLLKLIGKGTFSEVYLGQNISNKKLYSVKVENRILINTELLEREAYILLNLKCFGIPEVVSFGKSGNYNILVQTLLGKSLEKIWIENNQSFSIKDICMIAIQTLDRIEYVHSKNYLHRDIKPANFLVGYPDSSVIYLIDFGVSKKYRSSRTGKHIQSFKIKKINGTTNFLSVNALRGNEQSRKDDLESLGYMYIYLAKGVLPWSNIEGKNMEDLITKTRIMKSKISVENLCQKLPNEFCQYMNYVKKLSFEQKPDYEYLRNLFKNILFRIKERLDNIFSWVDLRNISKDINTRSYSSIQRKRSNSHIKLLNRISDLNSRKNTSEYSSNTYNNIDLPKINTSNIKKIYSENNEKEDAVKNNNIYINISKIKENKKLNNNKYYNCKTQQNKNLLSKQSQIKTINSSEINHKLINKEGLILKQRIERNKNNYNYNNVDNIYRKLNSGDNINKIKNKKNLASKNRNTPLFNSNTFNSFKVNQKPTIFNTKQQIPKNNKRIIGEYYNKNLNNNHLYATSQIIINDITQNNIFCENSHRIPSIPLNNNFYINLSNNLKNSQNYADRNNLQNQKLNKEKFNKNDFPIKNIEMNYNNKNIIEPTKNIDKKNLIEHRNKNRNIMFANINLISEK
jgi:casein kinase 1